MRLVKGNELTPELRRAVLAAYVHRHLAAKVWPTDESWLAAHAFYVTKAGRLSNRHRHCEPAFMADPLPYGGRDWSGGRGRELLPGEKA